MKAIFLVFVFGFVAAESNTQKDNGQREKRGFLGPIHHGVPVGGHVAARTYAVEGGFSSEHDDFLVKGVAKSAALAAAASKAASFKRAKAAQISKAAHAAQALAFGESSLASKTAGAVKAADRTYNIALGLAHKLSDALHEAEALTAQAWKSLEAAKIVEASQNAMVYEAQRAADSLSQRQFISLSELQAAQAAAVKAQAVASKAFSLPKGKALFGQY